MFDFLKNGRKFSGNTHFLNGHSHLDENGINYICLYLFDRNKSGQEQLDDAFPVGNITFPEWSTMSPDELSHDMKQRFKVLKNVLEAKTNQNWT